MGCARPWITRRSRLPLLLDSQLVVRQAFVGAIGDRPLGTAITRLLRVLPTSGHLRRAITTAPPPHDFVLHAAAWVLSTTEACRSSYGDSAATIAKKMVFWITVGEVYGRAIHRSISRRS